MVMVERRVRGVVIGQEERYRGLDAAQIESVLNLMGMNRKGRRRVFAGLQVMEKAALAALYGKAK